MFTNESQSTDLDIKSFPRAITRPLPPDNDEEALEEFVEYFFEEFDNGMIYLGARFFELMLLSEMGPNLKDALLEKVTEFVEWLEEAKENLQENAASSQPGVAAST